MQPPSYQSQIDSSNSRIMDKLQQQYNNEAQSNWLEHKKKQNLYYKIVQMQQASMNDRKSMQKQLKNKQDEKIKMFWQAQEQRRRQMQRRRRQEIDNARKINQSMSNDILEKSKSRDDFVNYNDYNQYCMQQFQKQKRQKQQYMKNAQQYEQIRKQKQKALKMMDMQVAHLKFQQRDEQERKRLADLKRIRDKHQQNFAAYHQLDQKLKQKQYEQNMLESYIVNQGANDQQARMLEMRASFQAKQRLKKQNFIRDLKGQLENDTYRHIADRKNQINTERQSIQQRNRYFSQMEAYNKIKKNQQDKKVLQTLKMQVKPRKLLPQPDTPEKVGLGSPVNIGKVVGDDRKRQLDWIEKSLLRQIHY